MQFTIEQIAFAPKNSQAARALLEDMGLTKWIEDEVTAQGQVYDRTNVTNVAHLQFNYQAEPVDALELELLDYLEGDNWLRDFDGRMTRVSHIGMHCSADELEDWRKFFANRGIQVVQEVETKKHTNAYLLEQKRHYHYVIFGTHHILGVDTKFIVRIEDVVVEPRTNLDAAEFDAVEQVGEALEAGDEGTAIGAAMRVEP